MALAAGFPAAGLGDEAVGAEVFGHRLVHAQGDSLSKFGFAHGRNPSLVIAHVFGRSRLLTLGGGFDARQRPLRAIAGLLRLEV
jgi:hypothetical protein